MAKEIYNYGDELEKCAAEWTDLLEKTLTRIKAGEANVSLNPCSSIYGNLDNGTSSYGCKIDLGALRIRFEGLLQGNDCWEIVKFFVYKKGSGIFRYFYKKVVNFNSDYDRFPKEFFIGLGGICNRIYRYMEEKNEADKRRVLLKQACPGYRC